MEKPLSHVQKLTFSGLMIALYVTVLYLTQSFSFGAYQIRIATSLYALAYLFPFLVVPWGLPTPLAISSGDWAYWIWWEASQRGLPPQGWRC